MNAYSSPITTARPATAPRAPARRPSCAVAVRLYEMRVPYGVVDTDGVAVRGISEKPLLKQFINAGIYLLSPTVKSMIPNDTPYDIPDLIQMLLEEGRTVVSFPIREYWLDIGEAGQYDQAQSDFANGVFDPCYPREK